MTIKELCKKHTICDSCPYLPVCGDIPSNYESGDDLEVTNAIIETAKALDQEPILDKVRAEIDKLQTYKMFIGDEETYVERDDVLAIIDKYKGESEE